MTVDMQRPMNETATVIEERDKLNPRAIKTFLLTGRFFGESVDSDFEQKTRLESAHERMLFGKLLEELSDNAAKRPSPYSKVPMGDLVIFQGIPGPHGKPSEVIFVYADARRQDSPKIKDVIVRYATKPLVD